MTFQEEQARLYEAQIEQWRRESIYAEDLADQVVELLFARCGSMKNVGNGEPFRGWLRSLEQKIDARAGWTSETTTRKGRRPHSISKTKSLRVFAKDDYRCVHCGSREDLTVDHILAWSKGGTNDESNLQTLCKSCNSRKGTR